MIKNVESVCEYPIVKKPDRSARNESRVLKRRVVVNRGYLNYGIDLSVFALSAICGLTGIVKWPGLVNSMGLTYQSLPFETITWVHDWSGLIALALVFTHLLLHWNWLLSMTKKILKGVQ